MSATTPENAPPSREEMLGVLARMEAAAKDRDHLSALTREEQTRLIQASGTVFNPDPAQRRKLVRARDRERKAERIAKDEKVLAETGIRKLRAQNVFTTPNYYPPKHFAQTEIDDPDFREVVDPKHCYICKEPYSKIHHFYDQLCPECAEFNFAKRSESADLTGKVALLTGGRVKIGYQAGIKLLRAGAQLIMTTRFPRDAAKRFSAEPDFEEWGERLEIFGLDLRHTPSVEAFCQHVASTRDRLDFIISNACQTVRRPPDFYQHMMAEETGALDDLPQDARALIGGYEGLRGYALLPEGGAAGLVHSAELSQTRLLPDEAEPQSHLFPEGKLDQDLQQVDLRERNSWRLMLDEVSSVELLETQLVNAVAPFIINARLKPLMVRTPGKGKHIINVSAVEGQFYRKFKTTRHPHTNMAKAALNMMTRTSAAEYHADGIHMNAVDTGWVTDEDPVQIAEQKVAEHRFHPPLDIVDGAARIIDPIIAGTNSGNHVWGKFLKDYRETDW